MIKLKPEYAELDKQPTYFVFPGADGSITLTYCCGSVLHSDTMFAPLRCLDCGSPWYHFVTNKAGSPIEEAMRSGWKIPRIAS